MLGDAHVDRAVAATTAETAAFQDFITRYAWGDIWADPSSAVVNAASPRSRASPPAATSNELAMHVRAARRNGLSRDEIAEVLLHTALYAGLPAANAALAIARDVFAEEPGASGIRHRGTRPRDIRHRPDAGGAHG